MTFLMSTVAACVTATLLLCLRPTLRPPKHEWAALWLCSATAGAAATVLSGSAVLGLVVLMAWYAVVLSVGAALPWLHPTGLASITSMWAFGIAELAWLAWFTATAGLSPAAGVLAAVWLLLAALELPWRMIHNYLYQEVISRDRWDLPRVLSPDAHRSTGVMVSVHVPCYAEPPDVVIGCLRSLAAQEYDSFEVLVIDNNTPDEALWRPLEACCRELGPRFRFFHVAPLTGAKGGALNFALAHTDPDAVLIAVVDSDYQVEKDFLSATVGYFDDPRLAHLQTRQDYRDWTGDPYLAGLYWEYRIASSTYLVSRSEWRVAMSIGTMCVIRRAALQQVGGWSEECVTEDSELSIRLHAAGHSAVYFDLALGRGLIPRHFADYANQRHRWTRGPVQEVLTHWRMLLPGSRAAGSAAFSLPQRLIVMHHGWHELVRGVKGLGIWALAATAIVMAAGTDVPALPVLPLIAIGIGRLAMTATGMRVFWSRVSPSFGAAAIAALSSRSLGWVVWTAGLYGWAGRRRRWGRTGKFDDSGSLPQALRSTRVELAMAGLWLAIGVGVLAAADGRALLTVLAVLFLAQAWSLLLAPMQAVRAELSVRRRVAAASLLAPLPRQAAPDAHTRVGTR
ncbi:glycosyltransferase [Allocatelliglobosispora scoriae]|nr:glycosyltransferase [Allocatelliglobosispora scoriae]